MDQDLLEESVCRNIISRVQRLRKESGITINDKIEVFYDSSSTLIVDIMNRYSKYIRDSLDVPFLPIKFKPIYSQIVAKNSYGINLGKESLSLNIIITPIQFAIKMHDIDGLVTFEEYRDFQSYISSQIYSELLKKIEDRNGILKLIFNNKEITLKLNSEIFVSVENMIHSL